MQGAKRGPRARNLGNVLREFEQEKRAHAGEGNKGELYASDRKRTVTE